MTVLHAYRDDGPLATWFGTLIGSDRLSRHPLAWLVPPLLRTLEYGSLIALTAIADPDAMPFCFALLAVLAFHHYDVVYRTRHQGAPPPPWIRAVGGGWDGRLVAAPLLAAAGALGTAFLVAAVLLGLAYAAESSLSWIRQDRNEQLPVYEDEDEVLE